MWFYNNFTNSQNRAYLNEIIFFACIILALDYLSKKLIDCFIFILLLRESDGGAIHSTNQNSLSSCLRFQVFCLSFAFDFFNLLLVRFHQAEIIIMKHLIQGCSNEAGMGVDPSTLRSWSPYK